jgi:uncharacterized protein YqcC (DUF446 family)
MQPDCDTNGVSYFQMEEKALEIEKELRRSGRWSNEPLAAEKLKDMGAFGENTMCFEEWLQFILVPRIREIVRTKDSFPTGSMIASYAIRVLDGDPESATLHELLYELDRIVNQDPKPRSISDREVVTPQNPPDRIVLHGDTLPPILFSLAEGLPKFSGNELESQLQTFDTFLDMLSPSARPAICNLLEKAAAVSHPESRKRIEEAAKSVAQGGRAAEPYNHAIAMEKYAEEHRKRYEK